MGRSRVVLVVVLAVAALIVAAAPALAQDYPGTTLAPAGTGITSAAVAPCAGGVALGSAAGPRRAEAVTLTCPLLQDGRSYGGVLQSSLVTLAPTVAHGQQVVFRVTLPSDFELPAYHRVTVTDAASGVTVVRTRFWIDGSGHLAAAGTDTGASALPHAGSGHADDLVKSAAALLAVGGQAPARPSARDPTGDGGRAPRATGCRPRGWRPHRPGGCRATRPAGHRSRPGWRPAGRWPR